MKLYKRTSPKYALLLLMWTATHMVIQAQELLTYNGSFGLGNYNGEVSYSYRIIENDTIFDGPFQMQQSDLGALLTKQDTTFLFKGSFKNGYPEGNWQFQFGKFQSDSLTELIGLQYKLNVSGLLEETKGTLKKGKPNGQWIYNIRRIKNSEVAQTLFKSTFEFVNGIPQKSFRLENSDASLVGRFLRDGLAHDNWTMYSENESASVESWHFQNGRLEKIQIEKDGELEVLPIYPEGLANPKIINLDTRYLKIIQLHRQLPDTSEVWTGGISEMLVKNLSHYKKIDAILSGLSDSEFLPNFSVEVSCFPLDSITNNQLEKISTIYEATTEISQSYLNNTQLNILKLSDNGVLTQYNMLKELSTQLLGPLGKMAEYHREEIWEFVDRKQLMAKIWRDGPSLKDIANEVSLQDKDVQTGFTEISIASALRIAAFAESRVKSLQSSLDTKLIRERQQQEFIDVEKQLIRQINQLNQLIDSVGNKLPAANLMALKNIKTLAENNLSSYSVTTDLEEKLNLGRELVVCFEDLAALEKAILILPSQQAEIESAYEDQIWNPFMANLMTERVKKRITAAYSKILIPDFLKKVALDLNCENTSQFLQLFDETHKRLFELRDEDTRKLERKLRRVQDPQTIMNLFGLATNSPEN